MKRLVNVLHVGKMEYAKCLSLQKYVSDKVKSKMTEDTLIIVEHTPVYTVGIRDKSYTTEDEEKLKRLGADFYRTNRGGLITFHGLGQMVVYPILNLKNYTPSIRWFVSQLEQTVIDVCSHYKIEANTSPHTGVWVGDSKICAIGIHVSSYITSHGIALNCNTDLSWFQHIVPCGIVGKTVTSLTQLTNKNITIEQVVPTFLTCFQNKFDCSITNLSSDFSQSIHKI